MASTLVSCERRLSKKAMVTNFQALALGSLRNDITSIEALR